jgi:Putative polyhydroxyalkanoic acid system protein (PHA_gran_rgn)
MGTPITLNIPHQLGRAEARRRIEAGFAKALAHLPGGGANCNETWNGDRLDFSVATMGQTVAGTVEVFDTEVRMLIDLPGMLGLVGGALSGQLLKVGQRLLTNR